MVELFVVLVENVELVAANEVVLLAISLDEELISEEVLDAVSEATELLELELAKRTNPQPDWA